MDPLRNSYFKITVGNTAKFPPCSAHSEQGTVVLEPSKDSGTTQCGFASYFLCLRHFTPTPTHT